MNQFMDGSIRIDYNFLTRNSEVKETKDILDKNGKLILIDFRQEFLKDLSGIRIFNSYYQLKNEQYENDFTYTEYFLYHYD